MENKEYQNNLGLTGLQTVIAAMENNRINNSNLYSGITAIQEIVAAFEKQQKIFLHDISGTNDTIKALTDPIHIFNSSALATNSYAKEFEKIQSPLFGLTASLKEISQTNKLWADEIANITTSQLNLTSSLQNALSSANKQQQAVFNNLNVRITGVSGAFLKQIAHTNTWEDMSIVEETNTVISDAINATYEEEHISSANDNIENLKESIISGLSKLLHKIKTQLAKDYIYKLITVIDFILTLYSLKTALTQKEIKQNVKQEITANNRMLTDEIASAESTYFNKMRIARGDVKLLYADKENAKVIGIVRKGQEVTITKIRHKYLLISYIDKETSEPKSGFVLKKYFISMQ